MRYIKDLAVVTFLAMLFVFSPASAQSKKEKRLERLAAKRLVIWKKADHGLKNFQNVKIDSFKLNSSDKKFRIYFAPELSYLPIREEVVQKLYKSISDELGKKFRDYELQGFSNKVLIQDLVPNWARKALPVDPKRNDVFSANRIPLVRRADAQIPAKGLYNNNIALWPSHGFFYETTLDRWEYQRARLFGTVEDVHPLMYMYQYIVPMLENAGASVFLPRERDTQIHEVVVDNNGRGSSSILMPVDLVYDEIKKGFAPRDTIFYGDKPFESGTSYRIDPKKNAGKIVDYVPEIPERGNYAVYVSYLQDNSNSSSVEYIVKHLGGETRFFVNQRMSGSTWVYLGNFEFEKGTSGAVSINIKGTEDGFISTDAVRFGGGMGNVARRPLDNGTVAYQWKQSGRPRYMEAARYYLQYAGAPDTLVYNLNKGKNDYTDDLQSRGEWINYLIGSSKPQYRSSFNTGLNVPVDLSMAFHTDAGTTPNDSVIGTLTIYSTEKNNGIFPNGQSKMTSRDFTDLMHTQIVNDIRAGINPKWTSRPMWDRGYSEAYRQIVPAVLLELLSHQNAADMRYSLDPRFRFTVSRAIYKAMLKYLAYQQNREYVVQPLPVDHFGITNLRNKSVRLSWKPVLDSLETTAKPDKYKVYKRTGNGGFDNGVVVTDTFLTLTLGKYDEIYSFKVTALNEGGESFPSEILAVGLKNETAPAVLVVNGFDRVSGPAFFDQGNMAGIAWWDDQGVPFHSELGYVGNQYDFNRKSDWTDDDSPGWGASNADMEGKVVPGNTFDFTRVHGEAILANGYSFVSVSDEVFNQSSFNTSNFDIVDVVLGEEKSIPSFKDKNVKDFQIYTPAFLNKLKELADNGKGIFLSGAYTGTDLLNTGDSTAIKFVAKVLHFQWRTNHAVNQGDLYATDDSAPLFKGKYSFNTSYDPSIYTVEAPDAIDPDGAGARTIFRYRQNNSSAGVGFKGSYRSVVCGFPFETLKSPLERKEFMSQILNFLKN